MSPTSCQPAPPRTGARSIAQPATRMQPPGTEACAPWGFRQWRTPLVRRRPAGMFVLTGASPFPGRRDAGVPREGAPRYDPRTTCRGVKSAQSPLEPTPNPGTTPSRRGKEYFAFRSILPISTAYEQRTSLEPEACARWGCSSSAPRRRASWERLCPARILISGAPPLCGRDTSVPSVPCKHRRGVKSDNPLLEPTPNRGTTLSPWGKKYLEPRSPPSISIGYEHRTCLLSRHVRGGVFALAGRAPRACRGRWRRRDGARSTSKRPTRPRIGPSWKGKMRRCGRRARAGPPAFTGAGSGPRDRIGRDLGAEPAGQPVSAQSLPPRKRGEPGRTASASVPGARPAPDPTRAPSSLGGVRVPGLGARRVQPPHRGMGDGGPSSHRAGPRCAEHGRQAAPPQGRDPSFRPALACIAVAVLPTARTPSTRAAPDAPSSSASSASATRGR